MRVLRLAPLAALAFAACVDSSTQPADSEIPLRLPLTASAISDGANGGNPNFFFLPPLASNPTPSGVFNGNLAPRVEVCQLTDLTGSGCTPDAPVVVFSGSDFGVSSGSYQVGWDTDGPETAPMDPNENYRIRVLLGTTEIGFMDINPQNPSGQSPGADIPGLYAFRLGENIPIKFWISEGVLCTASDGTIVIECLEGVITDAAGGSLAIQNEGVPLGLSVPAGALPEFGPGGEACTADGTCPDEIYVIIERINPPEGECIVGLDAPVYGPCFQIRTDPVLTVPLETAALVAICADLSAAEFAVLQNHAQQDLLQIHRQAQPQLTDQIEALPNSPALLCGDGQAQATFGVDSDNVVVRTAAAVLDRALRWLGPAPLSAADLGLGGLTTVFSRFQWALPGQITIQAGDDQIGNALADAPVDPTVVVRDANGDPVANARIHFEVDASVGGGTVVLPSGAPSDAHGLPYVETDLNGVARVEAWVLAQGANALDAWGNGLLGPNDTFGQHTASAILPEGRVTFDATAAGPPASIVPANPNLPAGEVGTTLPDPLQVTVFDDGGGQVTAVIGVPGVTVTWTVTGGNGTLAANPGDPGVTTLTTTTDDQGRASVYFTLGTAAGANTVQASVPGLDGSGDPTTYTTTFSGTGTPGQPAEMLVVSGNGQTALVGTTLAQDLVVKIEDQYDNEVPAQTVSWNVLSGGGSLSPATSDTGDGNTAALGEAASSWTLGSAVGTQTARATLGSLSADFTATATCRDGFGTATVNGTLAPGEWTCADSLNFTANLGGGGAPATAYWMNDGSTLYLAVRIEGTAGANTLRFDFDNDGDQVPEEFDDAMEYSPDGGVVFDGYLTRQCTNRSQAGCGEADTAAGGTTQGSGAFSASGGVTVYEMSKPLTGDGFDFSVAPGDALGWYLTLRLGNGAKGNTQVPGFRDFKVITIR